MDWEKAERDTKKAFDILTSMAGFILGIAMIGQGAYRMYLGFENSAGLLYHSGYIVLILGGLVTAFLCRKDTIRLTGVYAITLGASRFLQRCYDISSTDDIRLIFVAVIFMVLALNFIRTGIHFVRGNVVSRTSLIVTSSIMAATDLFIVTANQYLQEYIEISQLNLDVNFYLMNFFMYLALIALLDTKAIRENTEMARYTRSMDRIRTVYASGRDSFIYDDVAEGLLERSGPLWKEIDDGVVQSEMVFDITDDDMTSTAVAQIWKDDDSLFVTVVHNGDSVLNANRFRIDELVKRDGRLYGYGKDGTRFDILIKGRDSQ